MMDSNKQINYRQRRLSKKTALRKAIWPLVAAALLLLAMLLGGSALLVKPTVPLDTVVVHLSPKSSGPAASAAIATSARHLRVLTRPPLVVAVDGSLTMGNFLQGRDPNMIFAGLSNQLVDIAEKANSDLEFEVSKYIAGSGECNAAGERQPKDWLIRCSISTEDLSTERLSGPTTPLSDFVESLGEKLGDTVLDSEGAIGVLVTDLVSSQGRVGAQGATRELKRWANRAVAGQRRIVGLLGVSLPYFGRHVSERSGQVIQLKEPISRPVYLLFLGIESSAGPPRVERFIGAVYERLTDVYKVGRENIRWEILIGPSAWQEKLIKCGILADSSSRLVRNDSGQVDCEGRGDPFVEFACGESILVARRSRSSSGRIGGDSFEQFRFKWEAKDLPEWLVLGQHGLKFRFACESQNRLFPESVVMSGEVVPVEDHVSRLWQKWYAYNDVRESELSGTLGLEDFIESVREDDSVVALTVAVGSDAQVD